MTVCFMGHIFIVCNKNIHLIILKSLQESASVNVLAAISFSDIYTERSILDPARFQRAHRCISDKQFTQFVSPLPLLTLTQLM